MEAALHMHGSNELVGIELNTNRSMNAETLFGGGSEHLTAQEIQNLVPKAIFDGYFKFAFVRNPWDRFVSYVAWRHLKWHRGVGPTRAEFRYALWRLARDKLLGRQVRIHLRPQIDFLRDTSGRIAVDFVGRVENIDLDWEFITNRLGITASLSRRMRSTHADYMTYYGPITYLMLAAIYWRDVAVFGYASLPRWPGRKNSR